MNNLKSILTGTWSIASLLIGIMIGLVFYDGIKNFLFKTKEQEQEILSLKSKLGTLSEPAGNDVTLAVRNAHTLSYNFRIAAGYCPNTAVSRREGFMDLSFDNAVDLLASMYNIRKLLPPGVTTDKFRLIKGRDATQNNKLILVPLVRDVAGRNMEYIGYVNGSTNIPTIYVLDNAIDCPVNCDIISSNIICKNSNVNNPAGPAPANNIDNACTP